MRTLAALILLSILAPSRLVAAIPVFPFPFSITVVPGHVPVAPGKTLAQAEGLDSQAIYYFKKTTHDFDGFKFQTDGVGISAATGAALAPDGLHIAYDSDSGVKVVDLLGTQVAQFPGGSKFRWNHSGSKLAILPNNSEPGPKRTEGQLVVWTVKTGAQETYDSNALDLEWGAGDSFFLSRGDTVSVCDLKKNRIGPSLHRGVAVSPNSRYALLRDPSSRGGYVVRHSRSGRNLTSCTFGALGSVSMDMDGSAFWVRGAEPGRILCVSRSGWWSDRPNQPATWGARTGIVDVMTSELLFAVPGIAIGPSADGRSVWVYDGYDLTLVPLDVQIEVAERKRSRDLYAVNSAADEVRLLVRWQEWHMFGKAEWKERFVTVQEGDFIPTPYGSDSGPWASCDDAIRVIRIKRSNVIEVLVNPAHHWVTLPGSKGRTLDRFEITRAPVSLKLSGVSDGGYEMLVSVVP